MRKYPEYKPTIYDWLPLVPAHWQIRTMRSLTNVSSERCGNRKETLLSVYRDYGVIIKSSRDDNHNVESEDLSNYKIVRKGDLVMNKMKMWQGSLGISQYNGIVSPAYIICHISNEIENKEYLHYLLRSALFKTYYNRVSYGVRVGQWDMHYDDFKQLQIALPPREEQDQIVRFLDWKVSEINRLIAVKKREIKLLEEMCQTITDTAVFESANKIKFNNFFYLSKGLNITKKDLTESGISVISYGQVHSKNNTGTQLDNILMCYVSDTYIADSPQALTQKGDFIFADTSEDLKGVGNCAFVDTDMTLFAGYHTIIARPKDKKAYKYLAYLFKTSHWRDRLRRLSNGVKVFSITQQMLKQTYISLPPQEEQDRIVEYLDRKTAEISDAISNINDEIQKLEELKKRLISDVVTGQTDVRNIEIPEFEYVEEMTENTEEVDSGFGEELDE